MNRTAQHQQGATMTTPADQLLDHHNRLAALTRELQAFATSVVCDHHELCMQCDHVTCTLERALTQLAEALDTARHGPTEE
jgi:hypothetical protein